MSVSIKKIEVLEVELPFKKAFQHALGKRQTSGSVFVKLHLDDGIVGFGEALPREYVTGETTESVSGNLQEVLSGKLTGKSFSGFNEAVDFIKNFNRLSGAARCCFELSFLDAMGKHFNESLGLIAGKPVNSPFYYSGIIPAVDSLGEILLEYKRIDFKFIKVKVGTDEDLERLSSVRKVLGDVDLRVDANCAWKPDEAIKRIEKMREFNISAVEQPTAKDDIQGLKQVKEAVSEAIIADESLCSMEDARKLIDLEATDIFNIRLSKCGGILPSLEIARIAKQHSVKVQLGCHVGESGVLSAAGRFFACAVEDLKYAEGSYSTLLLKKDITEESVVFGRSGIAYPIEGKGLGVSAKEEELNKYTISMFVID